MEHAVKTTTNSSGDSAHLCVVLTELKPGRHAVEANASGSTHGEAAELAGIAVRRSPAGSATLPSEPLWPLSARPGG